MDVVAVVQDDRDAVADCGRAARKLADVADNLGNAGAAIGLCELLVAGKCVDDVAGKVGAIGRRQRGALLALEIILQDQFVVVFGKDEVDAGSLEISVEQQLRVRDDNGAGGRPMRGHRIDVGVRIVRRS